MDETRSIDRSHVSFALICSHRNQSIPISSAPLSCHQTIVNLIIRFADVDPFDVVDLINR